MSNDKTPAEGPYTVEKSSGVYVIIGPDGRWPFHFTSESIAKIRSSDLNIAYLAGKASQSSAAPVGPTIDQIMEVFRKWYYDELTQWDVDDEDILRERLSSLFK